MLQMRGKCVFFDNVSLKVTLWSEIFLFAKHFTGGGKRFKTEKMCSTDRKTLKGETHSVSMMTKMTLSRPTKISHPTVGF